MQSSSIIDILERFKSVMTKEKNLTYHLKRRAANSFLIKRKIVLVFDTQMKLSTTFSMIYLIANWKCVAGLDK